MNFVLTGATGFIGTRLIRRLLARGHFVSIFTRRIQEREDRNVGQFFWNMTAPPPAEPFRDVDAVIHLAGEPIAQRWTEEVRRKIVDSRVKTTRFLVDGLASLSRRPKVLVSASAIGYYGDRADEVLTEQSPPGSGFLPETCIAWEREALRAEQLGIRVVSPRFGVALGKEGGALKKMLPPFRLGVGGRLGDGKQWMSWIHVEDLVSLLLWAAETESPSGAINAVAPNPVTNSEFTQTLAKALHRPAILPVPAFALKALYGDMAEVVLGSQRVVPKRAAQLGFDWRFRDLHGTLSQTLAE